MLAVADIKHLVAISGNTKTYNQYKTMEAIIIITEVTNPYGKYWEFKDKQSGQILAEVDKKSKREFDGPLYFVYTTSEGFLYETARRSKKDSAIEFAKQFIREQFAGFDLAFKWNPMTRKYKWS